MQTVIEGLAHLLNRAVAIDDPNLHLLAHTAHSEQVDQHRINSIMTLQAGDDIREYAFSFRIREARTPTRLPGNQDLGILGRMCFPIVCQDILLGYLWLIDEEETLTEGEMAEAARTADVVGEVLFRDRLLDDLRRARERELLLDLVHDEPHIRDRLQHDLEAAGLLPNLSCRMVVVSAASTSEGRDAETADLSLEAVLRRGVRRLKQVRSLIATRRGGTGFVLLAFRGYEDPYPQLLEECGRIHGELTEALPHARDLLLGIGPLVDDLASAHLSFRRAQSSIEVARSVREFAPVAAWDELGIYRVIHQLPIDELSDIAIPPGLRKLIDDQADQWLIETLDTYLDAAGNVQESAKRMHIHRATLYYRLSRIEELTGMSLADGHDRLALHLGVKLARLTGLVGDVAPPKD